MSSQNIRRVIYNAWRGAKSRCENPENIDYENYGARGIRMCDEWSDFETFYHWAINNGWMRGLSLDRIDHDGNYSPKNCRWADARTQANNKRNNVYITVGGVTKTQNEWCREIGVSRGTIHQWIKKHGKKGAAERILRTMEGTLSPDKVAPGKFVYCPEGKLCFKSINQASKFCSVGVKSIAKYIDTGTAVNGFTFYSEDAILGCENGCFICLPLREPPANNSKESRMLTVNGVTKFAKEWSRDIGATERLVSTWIIKHGEEYAANKVARILSDGFQDKYSLDNCKPVLHIPTGTTFKSAKEAAACFGIKCSTLRGKLKRQKEFKYI